MAQIPSATPEPLLQVIYASAATRPFDKTALADLLESSRIRNAAEGITGMLVYHRGSFLQVLEGPEAPVEALTERIKADPRHGDFKLLLRDFVPQRAFGNWSMAFVDPEGLARSHEGFLDYATELAAATRDGTTAHRVLRRFQEGVWRQAG